jgi:hypothetical protein
MERNYWNEVWKPVKFNEQIDENEIYKISNYGRLIRYREGKEVLFKPYLLHGYYYFKVKQVIKGKYKTFYVHKLVAQHFLEQNDGVFVIHIDYNKENNYIGNLKWVTRKEKENHQFSNPTYKKSRHFNSAKLTENRVRLLKKILNDPNRKTRLKILAKQFGVSTMQLHRIKSGENWGNIPSL